MSSYYKNKCLVCLKTGGNLNIFTTYNISDEKEELYVDVIRNCFNIEITQDSGLHEMCKDCSLKLRKAYHFRRSIIEAVNKLVLANVCETSENVKQYSDIGYIDDMRFAIYDADLVLNKETDKISHNLDKINEIGVDNSNNCVFGLEDKDYSMKMNVKQIEENVNQSVAKKNRVDPLLTHSQAGLVHFTLENTDQDKCPVDNQITLFMDLNNILQADIDNMSNENEGIVDIAVKEQTHYTINHDDSYSLNILSDSGLNSFLLDQNDIRVLNIDDNSVKQIVEDPTEKPEEPVTSYMPFVLNNETDKKAPIVNVTNVVTDVDRVSNTSKCKKVKRIVVKKKMKIVNAVVKKSPVSDVVDKTNDNKVTNANNGSATVNNQTVEKEIDQSKVKNTVIKMYKSKTVLNPESGQLFYVLHKDDDNDDNDWSIDVENDIPEKEVKAKSSKKRMKTVKKDFPEHDHMDCSKDVDNDLPKKKETKRKRKVKKNLEKKDADTVKENVPAEDIKPKKAKTSRVDPIDQFYIMPGQIKCTVCEAQFETTIQLSAHMRTHPAEYVCAACGARFDTKMKLKVHMRIHEKGPFYCKFCNQEFSNVNTRNTHVWRVHSKPDPFKCSHCGERFKTYLKRLRHLQSAHGDSTEYRCQFCDKTFAYAAYRSKHMQIMHLNRRPYQCAECPASFARRGGLDSHRACKHGVGELKHQCGLCKRRFYVPTALRLHMGQVHNRYACNHCEERFDTAEALDVHAKTHDITSLDMSLSLDLMPSLALDGLADDYALMDSAYLDLNVL